MRPFLAHTHQRTRASWHTPIRAHIYPGTHAPEYTRIQTHSSCSLVEPRGPGPLMPTLAVSQPSSCCSRTPHTRFSRDPAPDEEVFPRAWGRSSVGSRLTLGKCCWAGEPGKPGVVKTEPEARAQAPVPRQSGREGGLEPERKVRTWCPPRFKSLFTTCYLWDLGQVTHSLKLHLLKISK